MTIYNKLLIVYTLLTSLMLANTQTVYQDIFYLGYDFPTKLHSFSMTNRATVGEHADTWLENALTKIKRVTDGEAVVEVESEEDEKNKANANSFPNMDMSSQRKKHVVIEQIVYVCFPLTGGKKTVTFKIRYFRLESAANTYYNSLTSTKAKKIHGQALVGAPNSTPVANLATSQNIIDNLTKIDTPACPV